MMIKRVLSVVSLGVMIALPVSASAFDGFTKESTRISKNFDCVRDSIFPPAFESDGALFSCIGGEAETVKIFINEVRHADEIANMKIMWNEWTKDIGYGLGPDRSLAKKWISGVADAYFPQQKEVIVDAFFSDSPTEVETDNYVIEYKYLKGPGIDEHLVIVTPQKLVQAKSKRVEYHAGDFERCKSLVGNLVSYSTDSLSGDGDPVKEQNYDSFLIVGQNGDKFFCKLHKDDTYKIIGVFEENYPFKLLDEGVISL